MLLDGNDSAGVSDLLSLLESWGPCKGCCADFDGNGSVGVSDLLVLLANWGRVREQTISSSPCNVGDAIAGYAGRRVCLRAGLSPARRSP